MVQDLLQFFSEHYLLSLAFIVITLALFFEELRGKTSTTNLSPSAATHLINRERATVIDIRDHELFNTGHIVNALNVTPDEFTKNDKLKKLKDKPIILTCKQGQTATVAASKLRKQGFTQVYALQGGIDGWKIAGLPLVKP